MAVVEFPAASFTVAGEPKAIRESGRSYARFAGVVGEAAAGIRSLDSGSWVGSEGEEYRARVAEIPPPLDVAHGAFGEVALALDVFAEAVEAAQRTMTGIRSDAESVHSRLQTAAADRDGMRPPTDEQLKADPAAQHSYDSAHAAATGRVNGLQADFAAEVSAAGRVLAQIREAADRAAARVRAAGRRSPTAGQNWFSDHWEKAGHWIDEHGGDIRDWLAHNAGWLRVVATVLKVVGVICMAVAAVVAVASFIVGCFTGVGFLGEIPAGGIFEVGSLLYGAGATLDTAVDWGEGKIDGTGLMWRAGLSMGLAVIGASAVRIGGKAALRLAERTGLDKRIERLGETLARRLGRHTDDVPARGDRRKTERMPDEEGGDLHGTGGTRQRGEGHPATKPFSPDEQRIADRLVVEGHSVQRIPERPPHRTADALVDGRLVEFKTVTTDRAETVMDRLRSSLKGEGQSGEVVVDASGTAMTRETAEEAVRRFLGTRYGDRLTGVTIWGDGWTFTWGDPL